MTTEVGPATLAALHAAAFDAPWSEAEIAALLAGPGVAALAEPGGFLLLRVVADEAEILTLAVAPAERRRGVGRRLVEAATARAAEAGARSLFLEVAEDNAAAVALYQACGFRPAGRRRGYYRRGEGPAADALILARDLAGRLPTP